MIAIRCPADGTLHYAEEDRIGLTIRCRTCGATLKIEPQEERPPVDINQDLIGGAAEPGAPPKPSGERKPGGPPPPHVTRKEYLLVGAGLGVILLLLLIAFWPNNPAPVSTQTPPAGQSPTVPEVPPEPSSSVHAPARVEREREAEPAQAEPVPPCAQGHAPVRLKSGQRIEPDGPIAGQSNIQVLNAGGLDAVVRLVDSVTGKTARFVYVQAGHTFALGEIPTGAYRLQFQFGKDWVPECRGFARESVSGEFADPFVVLEDRIRFYTVTLSPLIGGKTGTRKIDRKRFLAGD